MMYKSHKQGWAREARDEKYTLRDSIYFKFKNCKANLWWYKQIVDTFQEGGAGGRYFWAAGQVLFLELDAG